MYQVLEVLVPVFSIILLGYVIARIKRFELQTLMDLIVYLAAPCLIFSSLARSELNLTDLTTIAGVAFGVILSLTLLASLMMKLTHSTKRGLYLPLVFGNTSYLGYPVALLAFGMDGLSRAVVYDLCNSLMLFSLGMYLLDAEQGLREASRLPLLYAVILGLVVNRLKVSIPEVLFMPLEMVGMITIPTALLVLGYQLRAIPPRATFIAFLASVYRILGGFLVAFVLLELLAIEGMVREVILLQAAMPSAVLSMILAGKYNRDPSLVASVVLVSTLLSVLSIPLILAFL